MELNSKIYIAGHRGLAGSALMRCLEGKGFTNVITRTHSELDFTDQPAVRIFLEIFRGRPQDLQFKVDEREFIECGIGNGECGTETNSKKRKR